MKRTRTQTYKHTLTYVWTTKAKWKEFSSSLVSVRWPRYTPPLAEASPRWPFLWGWCRVMLLAARNTFHFAPFPKFKVFLIFAIHFTRSKKRVYNIYTKVLQRIMMVMSVYTCLHQSTFVSVTLLWGRVSFSPVSCYFVSPAQRVEFILVLKWKYMYFRHD